MREYFGIFATSVLHMYDQSRAKNAVLLISDVWLSKSGGRKSGRDGCVLASVAVMFAD